MSKRYLFVLKESPYGNERSSNGLRWAHAVLNRSPRSAQVFLMGDGAACAVQGQETPSGFYNTGTGTICGQCSQGKDG